MVRTSSKDLGSAIAKALGRGVAILIARDAFRPWQQRVAGVLTLGLIVLVIYMIYRCIKSNKSQNTNSKCKDAELTSVAGCELSEPSYVKGASIANPASAINYSCTYQPLESAPAPPSVSHNNGVQESATAMAQLCESPPSDTDTVVLSPWSSIRPRIDHEETDHTEHPVRPPRRPRADQATAVTTTTIPTSLTQQQSPVVADI